MPMKPLTVVAVATLSALVAGAGVLAAARVRVGPADTIQRAPDGHYWAEGDAASDTGRAVVRFLIDTGASTVSLSRADAERLGLHPDRLAYSRRILTADGAVAAAPVVLRSLKVGDAELAGVDAVVLRSGPGASLLGMSYLGRLSKIEATPQAIRLTR